MQLKRYGKSETSLNLALNHKFTPITKKETNQNSEIYSKANNGRTHGRTYITPSVI